MLTYVVFDTRNEKHGEIHDKLSISKTRQHKTIICNVSSKRFHFVVMELQPA